MWGKAEQGYSGKLKNNTFFGNFLYMFFLKDHNKNFVITILFLVIVWLGVEIWLKPANPKIEPSPVHSTQNGLNEKDVKKDHARPNSGFIAPLDQISASAHVAIKGTKVSGGISLCGAVIDHWGLTEFNATAKATDVKVSPETIFSLPNSSTLKRGHWASFGWKLMKGDQPYGSFPNGTTLWAADHDTLTPEQPVTLSWNNGQGQLFTLTFALQEDYLLSVEYGLQNNSSAPFMAATTSIMQREGPMKSPGYMMVREGMLGVFSGILKEHDYKVVEKEQWQYLSENKKRGWIGMGDAYFLSALIPSPESQGTFSAQRDDGPYETQCFGQVVKVAPGTKYTEKSYMFAGPKKVKLLDSYAEKWDIQNFDRAVDFGWFYFLTKPMFLLLSFLSNILGGFGWAILALTVLAKLAFFPLSLKSYRSMARMKAMHPKIEALKARYGSDKMKLNQELLALYKKDKMNPASGCLPMLVQLPVFFALYKVLFISIEMRHAPFIGWIQDLSAPDPLSVFNLFGMINLTLPEWMNIGIWPLLMGASMVLQQRSNATPNLDAQQQFMFTYIMPIMFTFMMGRLPVGLVIYWTWNNILGVVQQWLMTRYYRV